MMILILFRITRILNQRKIAEDKNRQLLSAIKLSYLTFIITDENGTINRFLAIKEDMTEKINILKFYEEANEVFEEIFSNLPVGVVIVDTKNTFSRSMPKQNAYWDMPPMRQNVC